MRELYSEKSANYPRLKTDAMFVDYENTYKYSGFINDAFEFIEEYQLLDSELWKKFVSQFRNIADSEDCGWKGEFWGKMMRGACFVYSFNKNEQLYKVLAQTVVDMINSADAKGRISTYSVANEFKGWDLWCRKYVLLGMQYFLEICSDKYLYKRIIESMCEQVDYLISKLGTKEEGKILITETTHIWKGLNSSSILEPVVRLYSITGEKRYLDFAQYIVDCGCITGDNIFDLAYKDKLYPYQYPVTKAYEMTSCFEGLLELYRVTKNERYKITVINYANRLLESDFTVIGSSGCEHELFDHSTVRQANITNNKVMQETCVTVTIMKFFYQLMLVTGDSKFADAFEISLYNSYLGSFNTEGRVKNGYELDPPYPFDSYSPLTAGTRGNGVGGYQKLYGGGSYGCCASIASAGIGLVPKMQLLTTERGFALNLFINGTVKTKTPDGTEVTFIIETQYPKKGKAVIKLEMPHPSEFELLLRAPQWSENTEIKVNSQSIEAKAGYVAVNRCWKNGDVVEIDLDMRTKAVYPISYGEQYIMTKVLWDRNDVEPIYDVEDPLACKHIALRRGPVMLAQENRLGYSVDDPIEVAVEDDSYVDVKEPELDTAPYNHIVEVSVPLADGSMMTVTDYASAGKLWNEKSKMAVWMLTK